MEFIFLFEARKNIPKICDKTYHIISGAQPEAGHLTFNADAATGSSRGNASQSGVAMCYSKVLLSNAVSQNLLQL